MNPAATALVTRFFDAHMGAHPEEASTLGLREHDATLSDPSIEAAQSQLPTLREMHREAQGLLSGTASSLTPDERLDVDSVARVASFHLHRIGDDDDASNLELCSLPSNAVEHSALHARTEEDWRALAKRIEAVPEFLAKHTENLRRGVKAGRAPDVAIAGVFVERLIPMTIDAYANHVTTASQRGAGAEAIGRIDKASKRAADAYRSLHAFLKETVLPNARVDVKLGEAEVARRLRDVMGIETSLADLMTFARDEISSSHRVMKEHCASGKDWPSATQEICARQPKNIEEALTLYRTMLDRATKLIVDRELLRVPELALDLAPLPGGFADGASLTNWPAPLLDPKGSGHALYASDPTTHQTISAKQLAIHEGIPGHYLQSVVWQRMNVPRESGRGVRWIGVADPLAMSRGYFGTMVSVEGWAVYVEHLMQEHGFFDAGDEMLFFAFCDGLRAMRMLLELEIHACDMSSDRAIDLVIDTTSRSREWAEWSVLRAKRIPLQAMTYVVGSHEIKQLRDRRPKTESLRDFHTRILEAGPVPLSRL